MTKNGFTIIETVTYLGILSLVFAVVLPTFYFVITGVGENQINTVRSEEMNFILAKINQLLSSAISIENPNENEEGKVLKIILSDSAHLWVEIKESTSSIFIKRNDGGSEKINSGRVIISDLVFFHNPASEFSYDSVSYAFTIDSISVPTTTIEISHHE